MTWAVAELRAFAADPITTALIALLVASWLIVGIADVAGVARSVQVAVDVAEAALCIGIAGWLLTRRRVPRIPIVIVAYVVWVLTGLATHASAAALVTALEHWLLLPTLMLLLVMLGTSERRARAAAFTLIALSALEWLVTIVQSASRSNPDTIVGTFGPGANAVTGTVILIAACVGIAGFVVRAPWGTAGLVLGAALPLVAAWTFTKAVPAFMPFAMLAVVVPPFASGRIDRLRSVIAITAALATSAVVVVYYAAFHRDSFSALTSTSYVARSPVAHGKAQLRIGDQIVTDQGNALVGISPQAKLRHPVFRVGNRAAGDYTVSFASVNGKLFVRPAKRYTFTAELSSRTLWPQTAVLQLDWIDSSQHVLRRTRGTAVLIRPGQQGVPAYASGTAPAGATTLQADVGAVGSLPSASAIDVGSLAVVEHPSAPAVGGKGFRLRHGVRNLRIGRDALHDQGNARIAAAPEATLAQPVFRVGGAKPGNFTVSYSDTRQLAHARPGTQYSFTARLTSTATTSGILRLIWLNRGHKVLNGKWGPYVQLRPGEPRSMTVTGTAPAGAVLIQPEVAVVPGARNDATVEIAQLRVGPLRQGTTPTSQTKHLLPGRLTQWRLARQAISGSLTSELFGQGLGAATVATHLGLASTNLPPENAAASLSDFGSLLVERGWTGILIVALLEVLLVVASLRLVRRLPLGRWTTAFTVAVPGVVVLMTLYGMMASELRSRPAALAFWIVIALGLSPETPPGWLRPAGRKIRLPRRQA